MAPHALIDLNDTSGYYPSTTHNTWLQTVGCHNGSKLPFNEPKASTKIPFAEISFGSRSPPNVWNHSSDEISEIEKNVRDFLNTCEGLFSQRIQNLNYGMDLDLPLHAINPTTFPLTSALRSKLRDLTVRTLYGEEQFFILSGLDPYRYSDYQNVIIHAGLSYHVGSKRSMGGRTGSNNTVIQHITAMPVDESLPPGRYHGPSSRDQAILSPTDLPLTSTIHKPMLTSFPSSAGERDTAFPYR